MSFTPDQIGLTVGRERERERGEGEGEGEGEGRERGGRG